MRNNKKKYIYQKNYFLLLGQETEANRYRFVEVSTRKKYAFLKHVILILSCQNGFVVDLLEGRFGLRSGFLLSKKKKKRDANSYPVG